MHYGLTLPNGGTWGDAGRLAELARCHGLRAALQYVATFLTIARIVSWLRPWSRPTFQGFLIDRFVKMTKDVTD